MYGTYCRLNVHVFASNRDVITAASRKMLKASVRRGREHRAARHAFYRQMLHCHRKDRDLVVGFRSACTNVP